MKTDERRTQFRDRQHVALAILSGWLVATSPWIAMLRQVPAGAGWLDYAHVTFGFATLVLTASYAWTCSGEGPWRLYFPWTPARLDAVLRDGARLVRGRIPAAEGGGLFGFIEGLLLAVLAATAVTGAGWFLAQGSAAALDWRAWHALAARGFGVLLVLHVAAVSLHLLDFIRD